MSPPSRSPQARRLQKIMKRVPAAVVKAAAPSVVKAAEDLAAQMKNLSPVEDGDLRDSIRVTGPGQRTPPYSQPGGETIVPENAAAITVGNANVRYAHLVEYGTKAAPAQPFFWPAVRAGKKKATGRIKRAISKAVRDAAK